MLPPMTGIGLSGPAQRKTKLDIQKNCKNQTKLLTQIFDVTMIGSCFVGQCWHAIGPKFTVCSIIIDFNSFTITVSITKCFTMLEIIGSDSFKAMIVKTRVIQAGFTWPTSTIIINLTIRIVRSSSNKKKTSTSLPKEIEKPPRKKLAWTTRDCF